MARILDGKKIAEEIRQALRHEVQKLRNQNLVPGLAAILVGEDPASGVYVRNKTKACEEIGIYSETHRLPADVNEKNILKLIDSLNHYDRIDGILVQLPLPKGLDESKILDSISPSKDVDGLHPVNQGLLQLGRASFVPCTPLGVQELLRRSRIEVEGRHVVILGRSRLVGMPLAVLLAQKSEAANATVTICHSKSTGLAEITRQADILVAAIGKPRYVTADMVKREAIIIDVGINRIDDASSPRGYRLVGDVDFDGVQHVAQAITPVPGGVGPMTIAMLLRNTISSAIRHLRQ